MTSGKEWTSGTGWSAARPTTPTIPTSAARICGLDQHHCRFVSEGETTFGIVEPYDTLCYEMARRGTGGFSLLD